MPARRGRPRGVNVNPTAVEDLCRERAVSKQELASAGGIGTGHLADMLHRGKGAKFETVRRMADRLGVRPATIAPELHAAPGAFVYVRPDDLEAEAS